MSLPKRIKIGSQTYKVIQLPFEVLPDTEGASGLINYCNGTISLAMKRADTSKILLHEIMHGIMLHWNVLRGGGMTLSEEEIVISLAEGLASVLKDNKKAFEEILKEL